MVNRHNTFRVIFDVLSQKFYVLINDGVTYGSAECYSKGVVHTKLDIYFFL